MTKWNVTLKGKMTFERTIIVHADNARNASLTAKDILMESSNGEDEINIAEIIPEIYKDSSYEIGIKSKS